MGELRLWLTVDGVVQSFELRAVDSLTQDLILGVDFCKEMDMDVQLGKGLWRVNGRKWHEYASRVGGNNEGKILAECAGICELTNDQRQEVQQLGDELVLSQRQEHGLTSLTEHSIGLTNSTPIKHRPRRMSPMMLNWLILEVKKLLK